MGTKTRTTWSNTGNTKLQHARTIDASQMNMLIQPGTGQVIFDQTNNRYYPVQGGPYAQPYYHQQTHIHRANTEGMYPPQLIQPLDNNTGFAVTNQDSKSSHNTNSQSNPEPQVKAGIMIFSNSAIEEQQPIGLPFEPIKQTESVYRDEEEQPPEPPV